MGKLTEDHKARIRAFKEKLGGADPFSLEEAYANFEKDLRPERELRVMERVADTFVALREAHQEHEQADLYKVLMAATFYGLNVDMLLPATNLSKPFVMGVVNEIKRRGL